jgi:hypothetical protein
MLNTDLFRLHDFIFIGVVTLIWAIGINHFMGDHLSDKKPDPTE